MMLLRASLCASLLLSTRCQGGGSGQGQGYAEKREKGEDVVRGLVPASEKGFQAASLNMFVKGMILIRNAKAIRGSFNLKTCLALVACARIVKWPIRA